MSFRTPRGYARQSFPYIERFVDGSRPSYNVRPAKFLPVAAADMLHNDPIVLIPGTFVGRVNEVTHSALDVTFTNGNYIAPACPQAYTVVYGSDDLSTSLYGGTPDLDVNASTIVAATGVTSASVAAVKPLGVVTQPMYASWLKDRWENYDRQGVVTWLSQNTIIRIPAITAAEKSILPGDLVMLDDASTPSWDPTNPSASTMTAGRLKLAASGSSAVPHYTVGRCTNRVRLGRQVTTSGNTTQTLRDAIGTGAPRTITNLSTTDAYLWPDGENFKSQSKVEVVPGTGLSGSSQTLGRPSELLFALPDASGDYWALDILVRV